MQSKAAAAKEIADKYGLPFIKLQARLDAEVERLGTGIVTDDGVHPSATGHYIIAEEWLRCFEANK